MNFDIICFDFDSTLSAVEGIDALAEHAGLGDEVVQLTNAAMNGDVPLESVYGRRLELIKPALVDIDWLAQCYIEYMVVGVKQVFSELRAQNKEVHIISGGLRQAILPMANLLGIAEQNVHAVDIYFNSEAKYSHFEQRSPLAKAGGKAEICKQISSQGKSLVMVGDGQTDLEAKQAGAYFVGFGGVVERPAVVKQADVYVSDKDLQAMLPILLRA